MTINNRIKAFVKLGEALRNEDAATAPLRELAAKVHISNPWFTEENVRNAVKEIGQSLQEKVLVEWISGYISGLEQVKAPKTVAVIMAGNIPMVGFHDMLCVLLSGHRFLGKLSSSDKLLLPELARVLVSIEPEFKEYVTFTEGQIKDMDAVIATGSDNSARYFEYYFGKYPNIIRKNRNSVAVLSGAETKEELEKLGKDIFLYYGLGCRNVSKLFVPAGYNFNAFFEGIYSFSEVVNMNKYGNNYDYNKTVYLMSGDTSLLDNNFLLLKKDERYSSPIGVLFYEYYDDPRDLNKRLVAEQEQIQCVISNSREIGNAIGFGQSQCPGPGDYADGVDTMHFLTRLK